MQRHRSVFDNKTMAVSIRVVSLLLFAWAALASDVRVVEEIVAKVNGSIVTSIELARSRRDLEAGLRQQGLTGPALEQRLKESEQNLLRDRIDSLLMVQQANVVANSKELGDSVASEVTKRLAEMQRQSKIVDQDKFQDYVSREAGMPFEDFKQQMRDSLLSQRLMQQEVGSKVTVSTADAQKYYDEHKDQFIREDRVFLSQIKVATAGKTEKEIPALEKKAKSLVARARAGEKFGELARDNSDDAETAAEMGQLPPIAISDLSDQIKEIVLKQDKGYVTDPLKIADGFLILRIEQKQKAGLASFEEVQNEVIERLYGPRFDAAARPFLTDLRMQAFLEIRDGYTDTGAAPGKDTHWMDPAQLKPETVTREEVAARVRRRRFLWIVPVIGTTTGDTSTSSSR